MNIPTVYPMEIVALERQILVVDDPQILSTFSALELYFV